MIKDRGNIKWTAMMLPEHVGLLRELKKELTYQKKPQLDEQQLLEMNEQICEGMANNASLIFTYYENYDYHCMVGTVHHFNEQERKLHLIDQFGGKNYLQLDEIIDVKTYK
ncbi:MULTISPECIES: YolD-like family protein [Alkalihalobacterium]|uniref:YolD-like family protein n=1 Tax=Alkalihalobacterium chitinilyticum TaxID=2980103 RepID=A0ABT5VBQ3_9BACI|nr:YolD-like family protein [Alkalihalobacterium chitinilyticum]MDE5412137.1 YolD-like family protein [Alkalihalobacterium chitinilyticum]